jgi:hypothetical protein
VDTVVQKWYVNVMDDMTAASSGLEGDAIRDRTSLFYADDGAIGSRDPEWLQNATQHLCDLFRNCTGLKPNTNKTKVMICHYTEIRDWYFFFFKNSRQTILWTMFTLACSGELTGFLL